MAKDKQITSREDATTKDMQPREKRVQAFNFPTLGVTVEAETYQEAFEEAKKIVKARSEEVNSDNK